MSMEGETVARLALDHPLRIKARDLKLQRRDEERANRNALSRYRCPCNLCGGRRRPYKSSTVARHLRHRGRHGALRGWTEVKTNLVLSWMLGQEVLFRCHWLNHIVVVLSFNFGVRWHLGWWPRLIGRGVGWAHWQTRASISRPEWASSWDCSRRWPWSWDDGEKCLCVCRQRTHACDCGRLPPDCCCRWLTLAPPAG